MAGVHIHDPSHPHWRADIDIVLGTAGGRVAYLTVPKSQSAAELAEVIEYIREVCSARNIKPEIPVHALIETHGALADVWDIASLPWLQVLDFGMMDFVSSHKGAIAASAMRSPGQFDHRLLARAKAEMAAAALAHGLVPAHNVMFGTELQLREAARLREH